MNRNCLIVLACMGFLLGCSQESETPTAATRICAVTPLDHPSLGAAIDGFRSTLESNLLSDNYHFQLYSAAGDWDFLTELLRQTVRDRCNLLLVVTTPAAQKARREVAEKGIPVIYTAVTDPVGAEIVTSLDSDPLPITGVTDRFPVEQQVSLFASILPSATNASVLFNPTEQNSQILVRETIEHLTKRGIIATEYPTTEREQITTKASAAATSADMLIVNGDNMFTENLETVIRIAQDTQTPLFVGDPDSVRRGAVATVGPSYSALGQRAAEKALEVLRGANAGSIPSEHPQVFDIYINVDAAQRMGVEIPSETWQMGSVWRSSSE